MKNLEATKHLFFSLALLFRLRSSRPSLHSLAPVLLGTLSFCACPPQASLALYALPQKGSKEKTVEKREREREGERESLITQELSLFVSSFLPRPVLLSRVPPPLRPERQKKRDFSSVQKWRSSPLLPRRCPSSTPWTPPTTLRPRRRRITLPRPPPPRARATSTRA